MNSLRRRVRRACISLAIPVALAATIWPAAAQETVHEGFDRGTKDIFSVSVGGYAVNFDSQLRVDSDELGRGTEINLENDLGLDTSSTRVRIDTYWRFARKHALDFGAFLFARRASRNIDRDLEFHGVTYSANGQVDSVLRSTLTKFSYRYSIWRNERFDGGLSVGLSTTITSAKISGEGTTSDGSFGFQEESRSIVAPIPVLGAHAEVMLFKNFYLRGSVQVFGLTVGEYHGKVDDYNASVNWYPFKNFGFGVGYESYKLKFTLDSTADLNFRYGYEGLLVYGTFVY